MKTTNYQYGNSYKIAIISDFHNSEYNDIEENLKKEKPDIICIPGDLVYGNIPVHQSKMEESTNALHLVKVCSQIALTFMSLGNHEWVLSDDDYKALTNLGITLLDNDYIHYKNLVIGGLTSFKVLDYRITHKMKKTSRIKRILSNHMEHFIETDWLTDFEKENGTKILLSHHPEDIHFIKKYKIDYILSGHAHGGQWCYYSLIQRRWKGIFAPDQGFFPKYSRGIYNTQYGKMIVSSGLSNTVKPIPRVCNDTEIIYLYI